MPTGFLVIGEAGDYDNERTWYVAFYSTKEQAEDHVRRANEWVIASLNDPTTGDTIHDRRDYLSNNPYDPGCTGLRYRGAPEYIVEEVPDVRHVDEYLEFIQEHK